jgi:hypothetical protein
LIVGGADDARVCGRRSGLRASIGGVSVDDRIRDATRAAVASLLLRTGLDETETDRQKNDQHKQPMNE